MGANCFSFLFNEANLWRLTSEGLPWTGAVYQMPGGSHQPATSCPWASQKPHLDGIVEPCQKDRPWFHPMLIWTGIPTGCFGGQGGQQAPSVAGTSCHLTLPLPQLCLLMPTLPTVLVNSHCSILPTDRQSSSSIMDQYWDLPLTWKEVGVLWKPTLIGLKQFQCCLQESCSQPRFKTHHRVSLWVTIRYLVTNMLLQCLKGGVLVGLGENNSTYFKFGCLSIYCTDFLKMYWVSLSKTTQHAHSYEVNTFITFQLAFRDHLQQTWERGRTEKNNLQTCQY